MSEKFETSAAGAETPPAPNAPLGRKQLQQVNTVTIDDLLEVLGLGIRDFRTAPAYGLFFSGIYAVGGWMLILLLLVFDMPYLVYPLAAGFALIAPFIASGFYVVSQHLEDDPKEGCRVLCWSVVLNTVKSMFSRDLGWMALVTGFSLFIWMDIAALLSFGFMSFQLFSFSELLEMIFTTPFGWLFLVVGNLTGAIIAFGVFSYSVISIPMLFDRHIDFVTAMITSVRFVIQNPRVMAVWCLTIAALIAISFLSGLIGLLVIMPVLGHASWHLYRRGVAAPQS
ncbi:MAG: DUF2189 domain-containing protein [Alphaproteobacteria bacterium]|nr:DUF2189 domain-containing protein [Alphaproteobacteria bacterium]MBT7943606.1 DUF2189 domain-containing protein [Alphaproteobacteria bacterium]